MLLHRLISLEHLRSHLYLWFECVLNIINHNECTRCVVFYFEQFRLVPLMKAFLANVIQPVVDLRTNQRTIRCLSQGCF